MLTRSLGRSLWLLPFFLISDLAFSQKILHGVQLETSKVESVRHLKASKSTTLNLSPTDSLKLVLNFEEKCNNTYKDKRKWGDKKADCAFHNNNLIETVRFRAIKNKNAQFKDHFLLLRHGYNRGSFLYFEEITVEEKNSNIHVHQKLLNDQEVKHFLDTKLETQFTFQKVEAHFQLQAIDQNKTNLEYSYESSTDHWLLNKDMMVDQIFESTANSINDLFLSFASGMNAP